jgi:integrase
VNRRSARNYRVHMRKFIHYTQLNPDQLLDLARKNPTAAHDNMKEFWHKLREEEGLSSKSRAGAYTAIRSFLRWNEVNVGRMPRMFIGKVQYESYHVLETAEISKMIDYARTLRDQALISFLAQSGQRTGIVAAMKYRHVQDDLEKGVNPMVVNVDSELFGREDGWNVNKTGTSYRFALGRECSSFLRMSLNQRRRQGEDITRESWLFPAFARLDGYRKDGGPRVVWLKPGEPAHPIEPSGIHRIVVGVAKKAGVDRVRYGPRLHGARTTAHEIHPHTFRRWWKFQMRRGGVIDSVLLEHMLGQRNVRLRHGGSYDEFDPDYIRREYSKAESFLTVAADPVFYGIESRWKPGDPTPQQTRPNQQEYPSSQNGLDSGNKTATAVPTGLHRVVKESELGSYFSRGWHYVATLRSGRIVIGSSGS